MGWLKVFWVKGKKNQSREGPTGPPPPIGCGVSISNLYLHEQYYSHISAIFLSVKGRLYVSNIYTVCPRSLYSKLLHNMGHYFLDIQYSLFTNSTLKDEKLTKAFLVMSNRMPSMLDKYNFIHIITGYFLTNLNVETTTPENSVYIRTSRVSHSLTISIFI